MSTQTQNAVNTPDVNRHYSIKWSVLTMLCFFVITIIGSAVLSSMWIVQNDITGLSPQDIQILMDQDRVLALYTSVLGALAALFCAWLVTRKTAANSYVAAMILAVFFTGFGALSIIMHPDHHMLHQVGKVILPLLICGLGARLAITKVH